jgi:hypothetical protein
LVTSRLVASARNMIQATLGLSGIVNFFLQVISLFESV